MRLSFLYSSLSDDVRSSVGAHYPPHFGVAAKAHGDKVADVLLVDCVVGGDVSNRVHDVFGLELTVLDDALERRASSLLAHLCVVSRLVVVGTNAVSPRLGIMEMSIPRSMTGAWQLYGKENAKLCVSQMELFWNHPPPKKLFWNHPPP